MLVTHDLAPWCLPLPYWWNNQILARGMSRCIYFGQLTRSPLDGLMACHRLSVKPLYRNIKLTLVSIMVSLVVFHLNFLVVQMSRYHQDSPLGHFEWDHLLYKNIPVHWLTEDFARNPTCLISAALADCLECLCTVSWSVNVIFDWLCRSYRKMTTWGAANDENVIKTTLPFQGKGHRDVLNCFGKHQHACTGIF